MLNINTYAEFMAEAERLDPEGFAKARADRAEADALRKDAERYRWLRKAHENAKEAQQPVLPKQTTGEMKC